MGQKHKKGHEHASEDTVRPIEQTDTDTKAEETVEDGVVSNAAEQPLKKTESVVSAGDTQSAAETQQEPSDAEKLAVLEAKCRELQDQYLRKAADFDNYRKRMIKEKQEAIDYANTNLLSDLLQILDDFDRAIEAGKKAGDDAAAFMQGVVMIRSGLLTLLESKYGLQYYEVQGLVFNPEIHEAVATNPSAEVTEPTVGAELQKGYKLKERILRPAKVMVLMPAPAETP
jgi:grpE